MSPVAERSRPLHVDVVRRVESGHVLVLESHDLEELVGQIADDQEKGWRLAGGLSVCGRTDAEETWSMAEAARPPRIYTATLTRGVPGSCARMQIAGGVGSEW